MGNLYCEAQGPCPDPLLCKSDRHNLKVSDQYLKIFSHSSYVYEMLSGGCFVNSDEGHVQSPDCQVMMPRLR